MKTTVLNVIYCIILWVVMYGIASRIITFIERRLFNKRIEKIVSEFLTALNSYEVKNESIIICDKLSGKMHPFNYNFRKYSKHYHAEEYYEFINKLSERLNEENINIDTILLANSEIHIFL